MNGETRCTSCPAFNISNGASALCWNEPDIDIEVEDEGKIFKFAVLALILVIGVIVDGNDDR